MDARSQLVNALVRTKLPQAEIARRTGVSQPAVSDWFQGHYLPSHAAIVAATHAFADYPEVTSLAYLALLNPGQTISTHSTTQLAPASESVSTDDRKVPVAFMPAAGSESHGR
jgi:transcriptional regulator with XRE-family HTH domain